MTSYIKDPWGVPMMRNLLLVQEGAWCTRCEWSGRKGNDGMRSDVGGRIFVEKFAERRVTNRLKFHKVVNKVFYSYGTVRFL